MIAERHPAYLGIYEGAMSSENARYMVEQSDLLLMLGVTLNDIDTGIYTAKLDPHQMIRAALNEVVISAHRYPRVALADFLTTLVSSVETGKEEFSSTPVTLAASGFPGPNRPMKTSAATLTGFAPAAAARPAEPTGVWSWLSTVDHKRIGTLYLFTALFFLEGLHRTKILPITLAIIS